MHMCLCRFLRSPRPISESRYVCVNIYVKACRALFLNCAFAAVQSPAGDISYMLKFFRQYVGLQVRENCEDLILWLRGQSGHMLQVPLHLREDFSGTSLICASWCKADVRRTALGVDIDRDALTWGWKHNGQAMLGQPENQMCLVQANVRP